MTRITITQEELETIRQGALSEIDRLTSKLKDTINSYFLRFKTSDVFTWSMYRANPAHTGTVGPMTGVLAGRERYTYPIGDAVEVSPTLTTTHLFTAAGDGSELHALELATGKLLWKTHLDDRITSSTATSWDGYCYVACADRCLYSLSLESGLVRWKFPVEDVVNNCPCVDGTNVFLTSREGYMIALDASHSQLKWISPWEKAFSEPIAQSGNIFIGTYDGCLMAVWMGSGDIKWKTKSLGKATTSPALCGERVYYGMPEDEENPPALYAVRALGGETIWKYNPIASLCCGPAVDEERVFIVSQNYLEALQAEDGRSLWQFKSATRIRTCPTVTRDAVYIGTVDGMVHACAVADGKELWQFALPKEIIGSGACADGLLVFACKDGYLHVLE